MRKELRDKRIEAAQARFLEELAKGLSHSAASAASGLAKRTAYDRRAADPEFAKAWDEAEQTGTDRMEDELLRRAVDGVDEPVFYLGQVVGHVKKFSDTALIFALKARRPEKYRERFEHTGANGGPIETKDVGDLDVARRIAFVLATAARKAGNDAREKEDAE